MKVNTLITLIAIVTITYSCNFSNKPKHVEVKKVDGKYSLYVDGDEFFIKGAGLDYNQGRNFKALAEAGGNSFRTWRTSHAQEELDSAAKYGLLVAMGLDIGKELHGFDYNDTIVVAEQLEVMKKRVLLYKDHPNLLCWVAGNELNLLFYAPNSSKTGLKDVNTKVYDALSDLVDFIHEVDPHHPVTFTTAGMIAPHVKVALEHVPQIDFMSYQVYGDLENLQSIIQESGVDKPFVVTEWGPRGHWEQPKTTWNREIEQNSTVRANGSAHRHQKGIAEDSVNCLGSFVFLWGQKQERTPTWYGIFTEHGEASATVDEMTKIWTGQYPENRAPEITDSIRIDGQTTYDNVTIKANERYALSIDCIDHEQDSLTYVWEVRNEIRARSIGGASEIAALVMDDIIIENFGRKALFRAPEEEGDYRAFVYIYDGKGKVAYANIPFFVKAEPKAL